MAISASLVIPQAIAAPSTDLRVLGGRILNMCRLIVEYRGAVAGASP